MSLNFLEFEKPIAELEAKIEALRDVSRHGGDSAIDLDKEIEQLEKKSLELKKKIFSDLGAWQVAQLARHPQRPYTRWITLSTYLRNSMSLLVIALLQTTKRLLVVWLV